MISMIKLTTGEEIVADATEHDSQVNLKRPMRLVPMRDDIGFVPWLLTMAQEITLEKKHIMLIYPPIPEIQQKYEELLSPIIKAGAADVQNMKQGIF